MAFSIVRVEDGGQGVNHVHDNQIDVTITCIEAGAVAGPVLFDGVAQSGVTWTDTEVTVASFDAAGRALGDYDIELQKPDVGAETDLLSIYHYEDWRDVALGKLITQSDSVGNRVYVVGGDTYRRSAQTINGRETAVLEQTVAPLASESWGYSALFGGPNPPHLPIGLGDELWHRWWIKFPVGFDFEGNQPNQKCFRVGFSPDYNWNTGEGWLDCKYYGIDPGQVAYQYPAGSWYLNKEWSASLPVPPPDPIPPAQYFSQTGEAPISGDGGWHCVEMYTKLGDTAESGEVRLWVDGVPAGAAPIGDSPGPGILTRQTLHQPDFLLYRLLNWNYWNGGFPVDSQVYHFTALATAFRKADGSYDDTVHMTTDSTGFPMIGLATLGDSTTPQVPDAVNDLVATSAGATSIQLTWSATAGATSYRLERSLTGTDGWTTIVAQAGTGHTDSGLTTGTKYYYRAFAVNATGDSLASVVVDAIPVASGYGDALVFTVTVNAGNFTFICTDTGIFDAQINWGDGSAISQIDTFNDADLVHNYVAGGDYEISITGTLPGYYMFNTSELTSILNLGNQAVVDMNNGWKQCHNLLSVTSDSHNLSLCTKFNSAWEFCSNLAVFNVGPLTLRGNLYYMFKSCGVFSNFNMAELNVEAVTSFLQFARNSEFPTVDYDAGLASWGAQNVASNQSTEFGTSKFTAGGAGETGRDALLAKGWTIVDGGSVVAAMSGLNTQSGIAYPVRSEYFSVIEAGVTHSGRVGTDQVMSSGLSSNLIHGANQNQYIDDLNTAGVTFPPLPAAGTELTQEEIYAWGGQNVIVRQDHVRTSHDPDTVPALFTVYRADYNGMEWIANESVMVGDVRLHNGDPYSCIQAHTTQVDWAPPNVPTLWNLISPPGEEWAAGVAYAIDDSCTYEGATYTCQQGHTSQVGWEPPSVPALWTLTPVSQ